MLTSKELGTMIHYPIPPHLQKAYEHLGFSEGSFPIAEKMAKEVLSLPMWPQLSKEVLGNSLLLGGTSL